MFNLRDKSILENIIAIVESPENMARIDRHVNADQIINGNQDELIKRELKKRYSESHDDMICIALAIGKKIIRKLSRCYSPGVKRRVLDKKTGTENVALTKLINHIYDDSSDEFASFDDVMGTANEYYSNHLYAEIFTYLDDENHVRFKPMPQHLFTAIPNKTKTRAEVIIFKHDHTDWANVARFIDWNNIPEDFQNGDVEGIYTIWSKEYNFTFSRLKTIKNDPETRSDEVIFTIVFTETKDNEDGVNPFEKMPFSQIKQKTVGSFYPYGNEIAETSKAINLILSDIVSIAKNQGFGQAVIYYDTEKPPAITKSGPTHIVNIPNKTGNSKFEFANPNPDLDGHLNIALAIVRLLLSTNDLTTDKVSGELNATQFASAVDRLIADSETIENIEDQQIKYKASEKVTFENTITQVKYIKSVNKYPDDYPEIAESDLDIKKYKIEVIFNSQKPMITEKDKSADIVYLHENGLILAHEKHMRFNKGMTAEDARKREEEIKKEKEKNKDEVINGDGEPGNQDQLNGISEGKQGKIEEPEQPRQNIIGKPDIRSNKKKNEKRKGSNGKRKGIQSTK